MNVLGKNEAVNWKLLKNTQCFNVEAGSMRRTRQMMWNGKYKPSEVYNGQTTWAIDTNRNSHFENLLIIFSNSFSILNRKTLIASICSHEFLILYFILVKLLLLPLKCLHLSKRVWLRNILQKYIYFVLSFPS